MRNWKEFFERAAEEGTAELYPFVNKVSLEFIEYVVEFLRGTECLVVGGAALDYSREREANDIDILITEEVEKEIEAYSNEQVFNTDAYSSDIKRYKSALHESIVRVHKYHKGTLGIDFLVPKEKNNFFNTIQTCFDLNLKTTALRWVDGHIVHMTSEHYRDAVKSRTVDVINERDIHRSAERAAAAAERYGMYISKRVADELISHSERMMHSDFENAQFRHEHRTHSIHLKTKEGSQ